MRIAIGIATRGRATILAETLAELGRQSRAPDRVIVVHDDLDLPFETLRLKSGGGHGGQNGVRDIIKALGTPDFLRVRVGIGRPPGQQSAADYVLRDFPVSERAALPFVLDEAADAIERIIDDGLVAAQQRHHAPKA